MKQLIEAEVPEGFKVLEVAIYKPSPDYSAEADTIHTANYRLVDPAQEPVANYGKVLHASLCRRFGYSHDEQFWWRDLVSLEEHIASLMAHPPVKEAMGWRPIETAPKDGSEFIVWHDGSAVWESAVYDSAGGICDADQHEQPFDEPTLCQFLNGEFDCASYSFNAAGYLIDKYNSGAIKEIESPDNYTHRLTCWMPKPSDQREVVAEGDV